MPCGDCVLKRKFTAQEQKRKKLPRLFALDDRSSCLMGDVIFIEMVYSFAVEIKEAF